MHPFFNILGYDVPAYWLMGILGICTSALVLFARKKQISISGEDIRFIGLMAIVGAIIGAKLLQFILILPFIIRNFSKLINSPDIFTAILMGGGVFYGGVIGGAVCVFRYCRRYNVPIEETVALYVPIIPLFHTFGRIGCFLAGCCWGIEHKHGIVYNHSLAAPNNVPLLPIQLIEAGFNLILFVVLLNCAKKLKRPAFVLPLYMILYGIARFVLEFYRGDAERGIALLSTSQWISIVCVMLAIIFLTHAFNKKEDK